MDDLASREAPLEYWFWKAGTPSGGVILDYIVRRTIGEAELRVSTWANGLARPVIHHRSTDWWASPTGVRIDGAVLDANGCRGEAEGSAWELTWELGPARVAPRPDWFGPLHPFDLEIVVRPDVFMRGSVSIDGRALTIDGAGAVSHYWGRRLPSRWTWISATGLADDPDARAEALLASSRMWGVGPGVPAGYVWLRDGDRADGTVALLTGAVSARRDGYAVRLSSLRADGRRQVLACSAPATAFNDAGEGIEQTMLADLVIDDRPRTTGSVGLEFRSG